MIIVSGWFYSLNCQRIETKGPNLSQGYSRRGQVGKLGREGPSVSPQFSPNGCALPLTGVKHLQTKQNTLPPDFLHMQLPPRRWKLCAANGGVLREAKTMVADKKTEVNAGAALAP